jgi:hypothetical protein
MPRKEFSNLSENIVEENTKSNLQLLQIRINEEKKKEEEEEKN